MRIIVATAVVFAVGCSNSDSSASGTSPGAASSMMGAATSFCASTTNRQAECAGAVEAAQIDMAIDQCVEEYGARPLLPEFLDSVSDCAETLTCDQVLQDLDDLCFPPALDALKGMLLTAETFDACERGSEECEQRAIGGQITELGVVGDCLRRWGACTDQRARANVYWTEDHCITLVALAEAARTEAAACLARPCVEIGQCLLDAGAIGY